MTFIFTLTSTFLAALAIILMTGCAPRGYVYTDTPKQETIVSYAAFASNRPPVPARINGKCHIVWWDVANRQIRVPMAETFCVQGDQYQLILRAMTPVQPPAAVPPKPVAPPTTAPAAEEAK